MAKVDFTNKIERLEVFEERLEVNLESLFAALDADDEDNYSMEILGELQARDGTNLKENIKIVASVYDKSGRIIATDDSTFYSEEDFYGLEAFQIRFFNLATPEISKIRLYPKKA